MNLGVLCTTGAPGGDDSYVTVSGGYQNTARAEIATVSGGAANQANYLGSVIGGGNANTITAIGGTVSGGQFNSAGYYSAVGGGDDNSASGPTASVMGGEGNLASGSWSSIGGGKNDTASGDYATVSGGIQNTASINDAAVGGGAWNTASGWGSVISGGDENLAAGTQSVVGGGARDTVYGEASVVSGGRYNVIFAAASVIPGGQYNRIETTADNSLAFGRNVSVGSAYRAIFFESTYSGRLGINRDNAQRIDHSIHVGASSSNGNGAYLSAGGVWVSTSSREKKENFQPVNGDSLLSKIHGLSIESWQYKNTNERHIGPVSEEFVRAFDVGTTFSTGQRDNKHLASMDVAGVALCGVQELNRTIVELKANNEAKQKEIVELRERLSALEELVQSALAVTKDEAGKHLSMK